MTALLFDIGNVLLFFDHDRSCSRIAALCGCSPAAVRNAVFGSGLERDYDEGRIATRDFITRIKSVLSLDVPDEVVRRLWCDIFWPNRPALSLATRLGREHRTILVSNTNELHMTHIRARFPEFQQFHGAALSYQVGESKPSRAIFETACARAGAPPHDCVYVDDVAEYCEAAGRLGMRTITYRRGLDLKAALSPLIGLSGNA